MKLFVITKSSELMLEQIINTPSHERIVLTVPKLINPLLEVGISAIPVYIQNTTTAKQRDSAFYKAAMPGVLGDRCFESTSLETWKVLGIDRLRFWYYPFDDIIDIIDAIEFDELVVSFDLKSPLVWQAVEHVGKCSAVKVGSILDRQHLDFLRWYNKVHTLHVSYNAERNFLKQQKIAVKKIVSRGLTPPERPRASNLEEKTVGLYYESKYDWKFMSLLNDLHLNGKTLIIGFPNNSEWLSFLQTFPNVTNAPNIRLADAVSLFTCEELLLPCFVESLVAQVPQNIQITYYDIANTEKASLFKDVLWK